MIACISSVVVRTFVVEMGRMKVFLLSHASHYVPFRWQSPNVLPSRVEVQYEARMFS